MRSGAIRSILPFFILPAIFFGVLALSYLRTADNYELETLDLRFKLRPQPATTDKVVFVEIGDDSIATLGRWPFDRNYHALVIKALSSFGARAILFDLFFSETNEQDKDVEAAMKEAGNVYMPVVFELDGKNRKSSLSSDKYAAITIDSYRSAVKGEGQINIIPDHDGKFRRVPLYIQDKDVKVPYISFLIGCEYLGIPQKDITFFPGKYIKAGESLTIPLDEHSDMVINYSGRWGACYKHYSYVDVIQSYMAPMLGQDPILKAEDFKGKICIVGLTASGTVDLHPNPFETLYPGMGIHAEMINSLITGKFIARASRAGNLGILAALLAIVTLITLKMKPVKGLIALCSIAIAYIVAAVLAFDISGIWVDIFYPVATIGSTFLGIMLYRYVVEWKKRLMFENELSIAKKIQESFLPKGVPEIEGVEIAKGMFTAHQVGGDLYDFLNFTDSRLGIMIGDVSGKGIPASLFMAMVTGEFKFFSGQDTRPQETLLNLNEKLIKDSTSNLFVTMYYLALDMAGHTIAYANGGHLPMLRVSNNGTEFLDVMEGAPLGLMEGPYSGGHASFAKGDVFILYTDGVTEAMNHRRDLYGKERLSAVVLRSRDLSSKEILNAIARDVKKFESGAGQHDDMTIIVIKINR
jgi:CHASE2 domain-containing sensor protein